MTHNERNWLTHFLLRLSVRLEDAEKLRCEIFLPYKLLVDDTLTQFVKYRQKSPTLMGLERRLNASLPTMPTQAEVEDLKKSGAGLDYRKWTADYAYWFVAKQPEQQRALFLGLGGMTTVFLPPDPKTVAPKLPFTPKLRAAHPAFKRFDVDANHQAVYSMTDAFLERSKLLFGKGLEDEPAYDGLAFVLPSLTTGDFFSTETQTRAGWFQVFDLYVRESPEDRGVVLAFRKDFEGHLLAVLESMRQDNLLYPEFRKQ